jgi:hypothetical protein
LRRIATLEEFGKFVELTCQRRAVEDELTFVLRFGCEIVLRANERCAAGPDQHGKRGDNRKSEFHETSLSSSLAAPISR